MILEVEVVVALGSSLVDAVELVESPSSWCVFPLAIAQVPPKDTDLYVPVRCQLPYIDYTYSTWISEACAVRMYLTAQQKVLKNHFLKLIDGPCQVLY